MHHTRHHELRWWRPTTSAETQVQPAGCWCKHVCQHNARTKLTPNRCPTYGFSRPADAFNVWPRSNSAAERTRPADTSCTTVLRVKHCARARSDRSLKNATSLACTSHPGPTASAPVSGALAGAGSNGEKAGAAAAVPSAAAPPLASKLAMARSGVVSRTRRTAR